METRNDVHRPSAIVPSDYAYVSFKYYGGSDIGAIFFMKSENERLAAHMATTGGQFSQHQHGGLCHICGQGNISYAAVFYHAKSNTYIVTGQDCAMKVELSAGDWNRFRAAITNALEAKAGKAKAKAVLTEAGLSQAWELYSVTIPAKLEAAQKQFDADGVPRKVLTYEEVTLNDIVGKLVKYGSISDKATNYVRVLLQKIADRPAIEAARAAENEKAADCPTGRVTVTGKILTTREEDSPYGHVTKMLVQDASGYRVWGTMPRSLAADKGDSITFVATVTRSDKDAKFGFYSRPVKAAKVDSKA